MPNPLRRLTERWLFRLRDAEAGEVFLGQRRVFILPTRAGLTFAAMLVVLFLCAVNYDLSLGFALTFLVAGCAVVDMHLTFRNLAHLHLSPGRTQPVFAGEEAQFELHLANRRRHDRFALSVGFIGDGIPDLAHAVDVPAGATANVQLSVLAGERGWLDAPRVRLETRFPLGLLRAWSYWRPALRVLVYPRPEDNAPDLPLVGEQYENGRGQAGHDDFAGIRAYRAGDSLKHMAWRQIARVDLELGGALVTKQFDGGAASELTLDLAALPRTMDLETRLSRMTRWVLEAEARGLAYGFRAGEVRYAAALGPAHQAACLRELALHGEAR